MGSIAFTILSYVLADEGGRFALFIGPAAFGAWKAVKTVSELKEINRTIERTR